MKHNQSPHSIALNIVISIVLFIATGVSMAGALCFTTACSDQGEGERCDENNNNDDCAAGLTCRKIQGRDVALCCPPPSTPTTVAACIPGEAIQSDAGSRDASVQPSDSSTIDGPPSDDSTAADITPDTPVEPTTDTPEETPDENTDENTDVAGEDDA